MANTGAAALLVHLRLSLIHILKESSLIDFVRDSLKAYIGNIASLEALLTGIDQSSINQALAKGCV